MIGWEGGHVVDTGQCVYSYDIVKALSTFDETLLPLWGDFGDILGGVGDYFVVNALQAEGARILWWTSGPCCVFGSGSFGREAHKRMIEPQGRGEASAEVLR